MERIDINIKNSIQYFIIGQIGTLITENEDKRTAYVKFLLIINCIEFLGAAISEDALETQEKSEIRFNDAIKKLFPNKYRPFTNSEHPRYFYKYLRCGMVHQLRPLNGIAFTTKKEAVEDGNKHLTLATNGMLVLVLEVFYEDLKKAALKYIREVEAGRITTNRSTDAHVSVFQSNRKTS